MVASASDWMIEPFGAGVPLPYRARFTPDELARLREGLVPGESDEKWFVYYHAPYLHFHRSWTGQAVYWVELVVADDGAAVVQALLATEVPAGSADRLRFHAQLLEHTVVTLLLGRDHPFPELPDD